MARFIPRHFYSYYLGINIHINCYIFITVIFRYRRYSVYLTPNGDIVIEKRSNKGRPQGAISGDTGWKRKEDKRGDEAGQNGQLDWLKQEEKVTNGLNKENKKHRDNRSNRDYKTKTFKKIKKIEKNT